MKLTLQGVVGEVFSGEVLKTLAKRGFDLVSSLDN